jgi:predicted HicB family RNase H-like nuclease
MDKPSLHIRLPADLHAAVKAEAERQGISLNAQITIALRQWRADNPKGA